MTPNRFATMLLRRTNKITVILVYVVLEWFLILLLLLNSLFSLLILKYAKFFGLKPPCLWCTRIDHIIDPVNGNENLHRDLLCEAHAKEVSKLGFCSIHKKLAESQDMCDDCSSSFSRIKDLEVTQNDDEGVGEELNLKCSCCGVSLDFYKKASYVLLRTTLDGMEYAQKDETMDLLDKDNELKELGEDDFPDLGMIDKSVQVCEEASPVGSPNQDLEYFLDHTGNRLVPIELVDMLPEEPKNEENVGIGCGDEAEETERAPVDVKEESVEIEGDEAEHSLVFHRKDGVMNKEYEDLRSFPLSQWPSVEASDVQEPSGVVLKERHLDIHTDYAESEEVADVSIGTEIPDLDTTDDVQIKESTHSPELHHEVDKHDPEHVEERIASFYGQLQAELQALSVADNSELNEMEDDKVPDTPASMDSFSQLHKKMLFLEKRDSWTEESLDGSVTSELEIGDGVVTIESLRSALKAERKALKALYSELEEERNASNVAASQTMAMINRLQEEKAAMQMEALQYQRMMEEQSEYDQDALQLLNELMVKREKEKQELEKELEGCRMKLLDYEMKEKARVLRFSSPSCSNAEDTDGMPTDLPREGAEEEGVFGNRELEEETTPSSAAVSLKESFADFEEERLSILEELKVLEEKLLTLDEEEEDACISGEVGDHSNDSPNYKHHKKSRASGLKGKSLLPLFDEISGDKGNGIESNGVLHSDHIENTKITIEGEVCHIYERLQALETDREFVKHCINSLNQGSKGLDLLQEVLQHLRDLRHMELRARNNFSSRSTE